MINFIEGITTSKIPVETILTFFVATFLIFIGVNENIDKKNYQKKNLLIMYSLLFFITYFLDKMLLGFIFFILLLYVSGISYLQSNNLTLEKELNIFQLFHYATFYWIFNVKSYILILPLISIIILKWINSFYPIANVNFLIVGIILIFFFIHYIQNTRDYFSTFRWNFIKNEITVASSENEIEREIEKLSFLYYMEDKNLFKRKSFAFRISDLITGLIRNIKLFFKHKEVRSSDSNKIKISIWQKIKKILKKFKKLFRGYSTIEQQVIRRTSMEDNSYRYTVRRKLFIERTFNKSFSNAWCKLELRSYKKIDKNAKNKLRFSLKYHYLRYYHIKILNNPKDIEDLINRMSKESRLSQRTYNNEYYFYKYNGFKQHYENQLKEIMADENKYAIINKTKS